MTGPFMSPQEIKMDVWKYKGPIVIDQYTFVGIC